ncbi:MAG: hypothetical protein SAK29_03475 [Scytonema sp. PMC 1069.18]|nr:hypothetical protein [Scytonema sp. PMC 1069.18]MEC4886232.1 hypothetical protein [Scytonema sp. PMC 1070.18]
MSDGKVCDKLDIVPRRLDLVPRYKRQLGKESRTQHQRLFNSNWTSYASQRHIRDIAIDTKQSKIWLATWGGILCWSPETNICTRHTSEHGLLGNATRCITIDDEGVIWAASQNTGLCSFIPGHNTLWQPHRDFERWTVLQLIPRNQGGIYVALRDFKGKSALGEIVAPNSRLRLLVRDGLEIKEIDSFFVEKDTLWIGNAWGLHRRIENGRVESLEIDGKQVRTLTSAVGGGLWLGTNWGLYRFLIGENQSLQREDDWPADEILSLAVEPDTGDVWVLTARELGRLVDSVWQRVDNLPPGRWNKLVTVPPQFSSVGEKQVLVGGALGLYQVSTDKAEPAFTGSSEENLSNVIHCLLTDGDRVWIGTAGGLHYFDGKWKSYLSDAPNLRDIRAILLEASGNRLWVSSLRVGLQYLEQGVYIPEQILNVPIVALATSQDETLWAASFDTIYYRISNNLKWQPITHSPPIDGATIQTICYQLVKELSGELVSTLWVGTSSGLFRYRPTLELWDGARNFASKELEKLSIQALTIDPITNRLWIGTSVGLFSEHKWQRHREADVQSLAFDSEGTFWLGTTTGLEQWPSPGQGEWFAGQPTAQFTTTNSGLADNVVTALSVGVLKDQFLLWIGSGVGVSCYRYQRGTV